MLDAGLTFRDEIVIQGEKTILTEVIENRKWMPLPALKVRFRCSKYLRFVDDTNSAVTDKYYRNDLFALMPYRRITRQHEIICEKRGYYGIDEFVLIGNNLFLTEEMLYTKECNTRLYVFPRVVQVKDITPSMIRMNGENITKRQLITDPFTYRGIREYSPVDEMRMINWKVSARTQEIKVNMQESTALSTAAIYLNLEENYIYQSEALKEMAIGIASYCMEYFMNMNVRADFHTNARDVLSEERVSLKGSMDRGHLEQMNRALARLDLSLETEAFEESFAQRLMEGENEWYTVFISANANESFQKLIMKYGRENSFLWIYPMRKGSKIKIFDELKSNVLTAALE